MRYTVVYDKWWLKLNIPKLYLEKLCMLIDSYPDFYHLIAAMESSNILEFSSCALYLWCLGNQSSVKRTDVNASDQSSVKDQEQVSSEDRDFKSCSLVGVPTPNVSDNK